ncbi:MAG: OmpA family protein [Crocinitomicaceae bacterium]|jgi:outer membrane protein OmpA-like peptidoglycan-associated protein|nr:OmpA family protein [Crocinitomicaceae bacterium]
MRNNLLKINLAATVISLVLIFGFGANAQVKDGDQETTYQVKKISGLNTGVSEFCPVIVGDQLVYTSNREYNYNNWGEESWKRNGFFNIYAAEILNTLGDSALLGPSKIFSYKLMTDDHSGPICFTLNGTEAFLTTVSHEEDKLFGSSLIKPQLYRASLENNKWKLTEKLPFNEANASFGHPCLINEDSVLVFVSDKEGGQGGKDLFWVERNGSDWSVPKNLGAVINTPGDELFPTYHKGKFYFASNGHGGAGGLDLFATELKEGEWAIPQNLGEVINSQGDDFGIVFNKNNTGFFASNREGGLGEDDIYFFRQIVSITVNNKEITGEFKYQKIDNEVPADLEVVLLNDEGEIVFRTVTDDQGKFKFVNIPADGNYTIKLIDQNGEEVILTLFGDDADAVLMSNSRGEFVYRKINSENVGTLTFLDENEVDLVTNTATYKGQFIYEKINGEYPEELEVYLVDDEGNIVFKTITDKYGNFEFKEIPADQNFIIKILETGDEITLLIYNSDDNIVSQLNKNAAGEFVYRKLSIEYGNDLLMLLNEEGDLTFPNLTMRLVGEFVYSFIPNEDYGPLEFEVLNDDFEIIGKGTADEKGRFRLLNIPYEKEILFRIPEDSPWLKKKIDLNILSKSHDIVVALEKDENGIFRFKFIRHEDTYLDTIAIDDAFDIAPPPTMDIIELKNIYYEKGQYKIEGEGLDNLIFIVDLMTKDQRLQIHVGGHTSATATEEFNMKLSKKRMQKVKDFLIDRGISSNRIIGKYFGEDQLLIKCKIPENCTEEEHRLNRRTELQLFY